MATIQQPLERMSTVGVPTSGVLNSKALPSGVVAVYLNDKLYKISVKGESEPRVACSISLLDHLVQDTKTTLTQLIQERRVAALYVKDGAIQSITLAPDQIQMMEDNDVNDIAFKVNNVLLLIKDNMELRSYASEQEYLTFTGVIQESYKIRND